jgi:endonuclease YncB( thermonuclease family)
MSRLINTFFIIFALSLAFAGFAFAHPGGLDINAGHRDKSTGEYHQHKNSAQKGSAYKDAVISVDVERVIDGDTFVAIFPDGSSEKVRLRHINTPERGEKGFTEATVWLKSRIGDKTIEIKVGIHKRKGNYLRGHYGRVLADIIGATAGVTP